MTVIGNYSYMNGTQDDTGRSGEKPAASIRARVKRALKKMDRTLEDLREHLDTGGISVSMQTILNRLDGTYSSRDPDFFGEVAKFLNVTHDELMNPDIELIVSSSFDPDRERKLLKRAMVRIIHDEGWDREKRDAIAKILLRLVDGEVFI